MFKCYFLFAKSKCMNSYENPTLLNLNIFYTLFWTIRLIKFLDLRGISPSLSIYIYIYICILLLQGVLVDENTSRTYGGILKKASQRTRWNKSCLKLVLSTWELCCRWWILYEMVRTFFMLTSSLQTATTFICTTLDTSKQIKENIKSILNQAVFFFCIEYFYQYKCKASNEYREPFKHACKFFFSLVF